MSFFFLFQPSQTTCFINGPLHDTKIVHEYASPVAVKKINSSPEFILTHCALCGGRVFFNAPKKILDISDMAPFFHFLQCCIKWIFCFLYIGSCTCSYHKLWNQITSSDHFEIWNSVAFLCWKLRQVGCYGVGKFRFVNNRQLCIN